MRQMEFSACLVKRVTADWVPLLHLDIVRARVVSAKASCEGAGLPLMESPGRGKTGLAPGVGVGRGGGTGRGEVQDGEGVGLRMQ